MSDTDVAEAGTPEAQDKPTPPSMNILAQYIKDFSFENPRAPQSMQKQDNPPQIGIDVKVGAKPMGENVYEVELNITAKAGEGDTLMFNVELMYSGLFRVENVPQEHLHPFIMIECPRLLFPFARHIVSDITRQGGFPPLMIDPVDFAQIYRRDMEARAAQQKAEQSVTDEPAGTA